MHVLVAVKRVIDALVKVRVKADGSGVETDNVKMGLNPFCEIAVEEAVRMKEAGIATQVTVVSIGDQSVQETLRQALALGADHAFWVQAQKVLEPLNIARILAKVVQRIQPQLVLLGKQSIDGDNNQTGQMLAGLLDWPQATFVSRIQMEQAAATVVREVDGGLQTLRLPLPAVITTDLRLNTPRYPSLPNIMQSKRKPLELLTLTDLGVELQAHQRILKMMTPQTKRTCQQMNTVEELVNKLKNEAKVI